MLAEVDYLKPYWDTHPEDRADLRRLIAEGRVEIMGGTYNEPNTNLTSPETTIRNFVHGTGFQRDVLGAQPATAWQLDVFGHDPQFPGMAADAGLTSSSWARGPHHQWGPMHSGGLAGMQFCSEFEWIAPSGRGLLTHYMPAHYGAGWGMDDAASLAEAEQATYRLFEDLRKVALTRNVLLPVGTDYTPPNKWVTEIHRDWGSRYTWPRFVCALPSEFFAAVRAELDTRALLASPQTRDMNPIYTGKDVSFIDTKQANRAAENTLLDAEKFAVFAGLLAGADYPQAALAKAWVQLVYGAHHDAITGSESDQVYLDLLTGWRDAWELGRAARDNSLALLSSAVEGDVVVWNPLAHNRADVVTCRLDAPIGAGVRVLDRDGAELPALVEHDGRSVSWLAHDVASLGWRAYRLVAGETSTAWKPLRGRQIANEHYRLVVDPARGGGVSSLIHDGRQLIAENRVGNELAVYEEYPAHPTGGEGPWHLLPKGPVRLLVGNVSGGAGLPQPAGPAAGRGGPDRGAAALHPDADAVARRRPGGLQHHDRRLHRRRPAAATALALPGAGRHAGQRGRRRRRRPRFRVTARSRLSNPSTPLITRGRWTTRRTAGSGCRRRRGCAVSRPRRRRARGVGGRGGRADRADGRRGWRATSWSRWCAPGSPRPAAAPTSRATENSASTRTCRTPASRWAGRGRTPSPKRSWPPPIRPTRVEVERQLAETGQARVWVPAAAPLAAAGSRRRPAGFAGAAGAGDRRRDDGDLGAAIASVADDLVDAEIVVRQQAPVGPAALRAAHRRADQPRGARIRRRERRHPAHLADAVLHRLAVRRLDRPAAPHRARRLELPAAALDTHFRLRAGLRRGGLAPRRHPGPQCRIRPPAAGGDGRPGQVGGLPAAGSLLQIEPAGAVQLGALKAAGNPLARRQRPAGGPRPSGYPAGGNSRQRHRRRGVLAAGHGVRAATGRPAGAPCGAAARSPGCTATRSPRRWRDWSCPGCSTPRAPRWPRRPRTASRCTRGTGCTTADRPHSAGCPRSPICTRTGSLPPLATMRCCA